MPKTPLSWNMRLAVLVLGCVLSTTSCTSSTAHTDGGTRATKGSLRASVIIPSAQNLFEPFILAVQPQTIVTWENQDSVAHVFTTTPDHSAFLNPQAFSLTVAPGQGSQITFAQPGMYHYYDTTMAMWNTTFSRVAAGKGSTNYPLAMDGVIWVQGAMSGIPNATLNSILAGHDEYASEFIAISAPGSISWHNFDEDAHFFGQAAGWPSPINPVDVGLYRMAGNHDVPGGQTITILFDTPGLYYYYCRNHDEIDTVTKRARALSKASDYPLPMEGFVLVVGK